MEECIFQLHVCYARMKFVCIIWDSGYCMTQRVWTEVKKQWMEENKEKNWNSEGKEKDCPAHSILISNVVLPKIDP